MAPLPEPLVRRLAHLRSSWKHGALRAILEGSLAVVLSAAFALRFGFNYGTDNQTSYLLSALQRFDPELLRNDWLTSHTTDYHPLFQFIGWMLYALNDSGWPFAIANFVSILAGGLLLFWICRLLVPRTYALLAYFLLMTILMITETDSIAITYFFEYIFQPSNLGTLGWLTATALWMSGRWWSTGIALALGGMAHANFLLMVFPVFGLANLLLGRRQLVHRLLRTLAPSALVLPLFLPILLASMSSENAAAAREILFQIRSPHHYWPIKFQSDFLPFSIWQALGIGLGMPFLRNRSKAGRRFAALTLSIVALVWAATALTTAVFIPQVAQLFFWRIAPFSDVFLQLLACAGIARLLLRPIGIRQYSVPLMTVAVAGIGFLMTYYGFIRQLALPKLLSWLLLAVVASQLLARLGTLLQRLPRLGWIVPRISAAAPLLLILLAGLLWVDFSWAPVRNFAQRSNLIQGLDPEEEALYTWVRNNTPKDAVFLTEPGLERFRLHARRAIVVDWKSPPLAPDELIEWYFRLCRVSGNPNVTSLNAANAGYRRLDSARVQSLVQEYGVQFAIVAGVVPTSLRGYRRLFSNAAYSVLLVRQPAG